MSFQLSQLSYFNKHHLCRIFSAALIVWTFLDLKSIEFEAAIDDDIKGVVSIDTVAGIYDMKSMKGMNTMGCMYAIATKGIKGSEGNNGMVMEGMDGANAMSIRLCSDFIWSSEKLTDAFIVVLNNL